MASKAEIQAMRLAITLSAFGLGTTSPNPPVGCVILDRDGGIVGTGYHQRKGESHAEGHALADAGSRARGGTAVVTLEPCNHAGLTPACRQLLIDAGVKRVLIAVIDPTSRGAGGAAALKAAGVEVEVGVLEDEARQVLGPWLAATMSGRPYLTWAYSLTVHGIAEPLPETIQELRAGMDLVVNGDGRVIEGKPDGHGAGMLQVPAAPIDLSGGDAFTHTLFGAGARTVLLTGVNRFASAAIVLGSINRLVINLPDPAVTADAIPGNYKLVGAVKTTSGVRLTLTHAATTA